MVTAHLEPEPGRCCVAVRAAAEDPTGLEAMTIDSDDAVAVLRRWELFGGRWRVLARTERT